MAKKISDFMKSPVQAIKSDKTIRQAASLMKSNQFGSLLVIQDNELGIITERDLTHALAEYGENSSIKHHISKPVISITPDETIEEAVIIMLKKNIRRLVVKDMAGKVVGIVNMRDILAEISESLTNCLRSN